MQPKKSVFRKRRRTAPPVKYIFMLTCILFVGMVSFSIWFVGEKIQPTLMNIANEKTKEFATRTINAAVKSSEELTFANLVESKYDNDGNVSTMGWSAAAQNKALRKATERAEYFLYNMNKGETVDTNDPDLPPIEYDDSADSLADKDPTVVEVPIGQAFGNTILANLGPKIPVNFEIVGSIQSDLIMETEEFGINAALFKIYVNVEVSVQIVVPFSTEPDIVATKIYVDSRTIMGDVPEFYDKGGGGDTGPSISIPKNDLKDGK